MKASNAGSGTMTLLKRERERRPVFRTIQSVNSVINSIQFSSVRSEIIGRLPYMRATVTEPVRTSE